MGNRKRTSVVNEGGKVWDTEGLYIADASVMPTATGVNPAITVSTFFFSFYHLQKKKGLRRWPHVFFLGGGFNCVKRLWLLRMQLDNRSRRSFVNKTCEVTLRR